MATGNGVTTKTYILTCRPRARVSYLRIAEAVGLPRELFLGRMVVQVTKAVGPSAEKGAARFLRSSAPAGVRKASIRGRKK
jgi:hypothetical protein